ncbi:MAG: inositol 2-dehydrogenase [bacterium]
MISQNTVNVGVLGTGRIGRLHAEHLAYRIPNARLAAVADTNLAAAKACGEKLKVDKVYDNPKPILEDPDIEAVAICTSTNTHSRLIEEAAAAGKQIFCEKPIDFDLQKIDRALAAAESAGVKLQIGFNRRFDPNFSHVQQAVAAGKIGQPHILRIASRDPEPPPPEYVKVSGGIFLDMTIHDFDMARYLIGSDVVRIFAVGGVRVDPRIGEAGDIDTAVITLEFANGVIGTIDNCRQAVYGYDQRVEVFGADGCICAENNTPNRTIQSDRVGVHSPLPLYFFMDRYIDSFIAEMSAFIECIRNDTPPPVSGRDARIPVVMGLAAKRSLQEGRPVALAEVDTSE